MLPLIAAMAIGCSSGSSSPEDGGVPSNDAGDSPDGSVPPIDLPPTLRVDAPARASWVTEASVSVTGSATDDQPGLGVTINEAEANTDASGAFSESIPTGFGLSVLDTEAKDSGGNVATDIRAVLAGTFLPYGDPASDGIEVQLNEGAGGIAELEALGATLVEEQDLGALIPSPVFQDSSESCTDLCIWPLPPCPVCVTWYSVTLYVTNPRFSSADLVIDPQADGLIHLEMVVSNPRFDWSASGTVLGIGDSASGDIRASSVTVGMDAEPMIHANGTIGLDVTNVTATANGFVWDMSGFLGDVLSFFGADGLVSDLVRDFMVDALHNVVRDEAPSLLEDALNDLALSYELPIGNRTYTVNAKPSAIEVVDTGITLTLATEVTVDETVHTGELGLGSLHAGYAPPTWGTNPGMGVGVSADFLNQLLLALWRGGLLDVEALPDELGISDVVVRAVAPGATSPLIVTHAGLPPVLVPASGAHPYELQLGDLRFTLYDGSAEALEAWVSVRADLDVDLSMDGKLSLVASDPRFTVDVTSLADPSADPVEIEALFEALLPILLDDLGSAFSGVALPSISGFTLRNTSLGAGGDDMGFWVIEGDLAR